MTTQRGKFITVEGGEGVGKSTNVQFIHDCLSDFGIDHVMTREPGGTALAESIRSLLLEKQEEALDQDAELLLMFAARAQHLARLIHPSLAQGRWVVCDRFTDATYAYQGGGRGIERARIAQLEQLVHHDFQPDLTLLLDLDPEQGLARVAQRGTPDRIESESLVFFRAVRTAYLERARNFPERFAVIDAARPLAEVQSQIRQVLMEFCQRWK